MAKYAWVEIFRRIGRSQTHGDLSRRHCTIGVDGQRVWLRDTSSNGVFVGFDRVRAPRTEALDLRPGEALYIGEYMILLDGRMSDQVPAMQQQPNSMEGSPRRMKLANRCLHR